MELYIIHMELYGLHVIVKLPESEADLSHKLELNGILPKGLSNV